jgi:hypothetical protein
MSMTSGPLTSAPLGNPPPGGLSNDARALMLFETNKKSLVVAYHNFYLRRTAVAVVQLILTITIVGLAIVAIWVIVDAFLIPGWVRDQNNMLARQLGA